MSSLARLCVASLLVLAGGCTRGAWGKIARIDLNGAIDPISAEFVVGAIDRAQSERAELLLIRLQTPGGFAGSMEDIITKMLGSTVPVVVYVTPSGAKAASAGFFILLAADVAAMAPGTNTGAAHPLMAIGGFPVSGGEAGKTLTEKITSNATAFLRSIASKRNRNVAEAEKGVTDSKSFTEAEALDLRLIDLVARDEGELLQRLEGYKVHLFSGEERSLSTRGQEVVDYPMSSRQKFLSTVAQPNLALLLGVAGLILLYFEFTHPGFVAPGVVGGICLLVSILGFSFLPINYVGVLLILLAVGLFVAEVKVQGFGVLGFGGVGRHDNRNVDPGRHSGPGGSHRPGDRGVGCGAVRADFHPAAGGRGEVAAAARHYGCIRDDRARRDRRHGDPWIRAGQGEGRVLDRAGPDADPARRAGQGQGRSGSDPRGRGVEIRQRG